MENYKIVCLTLKNKIIKIIYTIKMEEFKFKCETCNYNTNY
jgi:hypothetical protein